MRMPDDFDAISDAVDEVNVLKGKGKGWTEESAFDADKDKTQFRQYEAACDRCEEFLPRTAWCGTCLVVFVIAAKQTMEFNIKMRVNMRKQVRAKMGIWEAMEKLNTLVDDSDPDTELSQIEHLLQTAEAIRRDGKPEWMQVTGLVHDLGKLLYLFGSEYRPVGTSSAYDFTFSCDFDNSLPGFQDTFVVGCAFSDKIVLPETFAGNPDSTDAVYSTNYGVWGHDEYLYHILKEQSSLPEEGLWMIRYHSFYPWHRGKRVHPPHGPRGREALAAVRAFNPYDLYSKSDGGVDVEGLRPYYQRLIAKYFPAVIEW
ncbi:DUF706-domain-containing protein [Mycena olivaceomarginata]|nr:DUF706-domain-containing protein [Mycena olivaceomarginata]